MITFLKMCKACFMLYLLTKHGSLNSSSAKLGRIFIPKANRLIKAIVFLLKQPVYHYILE